MRVQKFLSRAGVASRRAAEELVREGRVSVGGAIIAGMGALVDPRRDDVRVDGRRVRIPRDRTYILVHKPRGVLSTLSDPKGRPTVRDLVPPGTGRVFPVGRLDWDVEGVLLCTDDGRLANRLLHPRYGVERTYHVKVQGRVPERTLERLRAGVTLEDGLARAEGVRRLRETERATWISLTLREGRHHEVKRLCEAVGRRVQRLRRVSFAGITAGGLPPGSVRPLTAAEVSRLLRVTEA